MSSTLFLHENITSMPTRNINHVLILFSLTNELDMTINGKHSQLSNHIAIINQGDLYQINKGKNLIELKIPMAYFYLEDSTFFNCHFDAHLLQSSHFIKSIILNHIEYIYNVSHHDDKVIPKIIQTLYKEAVIRHPHLYIPNIPVEQHILTNVLTFIHDHITSNISLQDIAAHALISESYCSNLFVRILNINFKDYYTSLKINRAIKLLVCTNDSLTSISEQSHNTSHTNLSNQFKKYLN